MTNKDSEKNVILAVIVCPAPILPFARPLTLNAIETMDYVTGSYDLRSWQQSCRFFYPRPWYDKELLSTIYAEP